jgi:malonate transporter
MAAMIPVINIENVCVLAAFVAKKAPPLRVIGKTIVLNPLILGCVVGLTINVLAMPIWDPILTLLNLLGRVALGTSLLCVGAGLQVESMLRPSSAVWFGTVIKLLVMPMFVAVWATTFGLSGMAFHSAIVVAAVPAATNGYILARQMGGDAVTLSGPRLVRGQGGRPIRDALRAPEEQRIYDPRNGAVLCGTSRRV